MVMKFGIVLLFLVNSLLIAYSQSDETRGLKPSEYGKKLQNRILASRPKSEQSRPVKSINYRATGSDDAPVDRGADIGVTFWRLRESKEIDDPEVVERTRISVRKEGKTVESTVKITPVRTQSDTEFADGDRLRMALELPSRGFIYILNREQYVDGTMSDPYLIFPSKKDIGKTDRLAAGKLVYIPNEIDYFEISRFFEKNSEKAAEVYTFLIVPQPLKELPPLEENQPRKIDPQLLESWQQNWGGQIWKFEQEGTAGTTITKAEKNAGLTGSLVLTGDDQLPQTIYHVAHRPGSPFLFTVPVRIRR